MPSQCFDSFSFSLASLGVLRLIIIQFPTKTPSQFFIFSEHSKNGQLPFLLTAFISLQKGSFFPPITVNDSNTGTTKRFSSCLGVYCPWHLLDKQKDISVLAHDNVTINFTLEQAINGCFYLHFFFHQLKEVIEKVYPLVKMARAGQVPKEVQYCSYLLVIEVIEDILFMIFHLSCFRVQTILN